MEGAAAGFLPYQDGVFHLAALLNSEITLFFFEQCFW
jgi:hypothetical protein